MRFNSGLISCFLLASAVLAGSHQSQQLNLLAKRSPDMVNSTTWAGARLGDNSGMFDHITGTFTALTLSGDPGSAVAAWIGIDGDSGDADGCEHSFVTGILSTVTSSGTQHQAFFRWYPNPPVDFPFDIVTGDRIQVTFNINVSDDWMSGSLVFVNLSRLQSVTKDFRCTATLCGRYAEWMVGYVAANGVIVPLANFSRVTIASASAGARGGSSYGPAGDTSVAVNILYQMSTDGGFVAKPVTSSDTLEVDAVM